MKKLVVSLIFISVALTIYAIKSSLTSLHDSQKLAQVAKRQSDIQKEHEDSVMKSQPIVDFVDFDDLPALDPVFGSNTECKSIKANGELEELIPVGHELRKVSVCRNKFGSEHVSVIQIETVSESKVPVKQFVIKHEGSYKKIASTLEVAKLLKNSPREVTCEFAGTTKQAALTYFTLCTVKKGAYWQAKTDKMLFASKQNSLQIDVPRIVICAPSYGYCMNKNMVSKLAVYGYATYHSENTSKVNEDLPDPHDTGMTRAFSLRGDIYITTPTGTKRLTQNGINYLPYISADGGWIIYLSIAASAPNIDSVVRELQNVELNRRLSQVDFTDIRSMKLDGSYARTISTYSPQIHTLISYDDETIHVEQTRTRNGADEYLKVRIDPLSGSLDDAHWRPHLGGGKPVIYLYPTTPTDVHVRLQRDINYIVQIPHHGSQGWHVHAQPNGTLIDLQPSLTNCDSINTHRIGSEYAKDACSQNTYPYLYWAGMVKDVSLPPITRGWIVPKSDLQTFLSQKLELMGFVQHEIDDMTGYWVARLNRLHSSSTHFTISFLQTPDLNRLIPLSVSPKPDTMIRVFMNYEAHRERPSTSIPSQDIIHTERSGFVLTEWGGKLEGVE